jgi:hypothetical protein
VLRYHHEIPRSQGRRDRQGTLPSRESALRVPHLRKMGELIDRDPPLPVVIAQALGEPGSLL